MEVWAMAAVGVYSARKSAKSAKAQSQFEAQTSKEMVPLQGFEERRSMQFESDLNERNLQKERARRAKAFDLMASQMGLSQPGYTPVAVQVPDAPYNPVPNDEIYTRTAGLSSPTAPIPNAPQRPEGY